MANVLPAPFGVVAGHEDHGVLSLHPEERQDPVYRLPEEGGREEPCNAKIKKMCNCNFESREEGGGETPV